MTHKIIRSKTMREHYISGNGKVFCSHRHSNVFRALACLRVMEESGVRRCAIYRVNYSRRKNVWLRKCEEIGLA